MEGCNAHLDKTNGRHDRHIRYSFTQVTELLPLAGKYSMIFLEQRSGSYRNLMRNSHMLHLLNMACGSKRTVAEAEADM